MAQFTINIRESYRWTKTKGGSVDRVDTIPIEANRLVALRIVGQHYIGNNDTIVMMMMMNQIKEKIEPM